MIEQSRDQRVALPHLWLGGRRNSTKRLTFPPALTNNAQNECAQSVSYSFTTREKDVDNAKTGTRDRVSGARFARFSSLIIRPDRFPRISSYSSTLLPPECQYREKNSTLRVSFHHQHRLRERNSKQPSLSVKFSDICRDGHSSNYSHARRKTPKRLRWYSSQMFC